MTAGIILCADDYALTEGVSAGIDELIGEGRLSATSALVNGRHWPAHAPRARQQRQRAAIGLHFNLTLGKPLGTMPWLCPTGALPPLPTVLRASLARHIPPAEVAAELERQLDAFEDHMESPPDFVDGHQHVHALSVIRSAVVAVLKRRYGGTGRPLLVRDPGDSPSAILARGASVKKSLLLATLARGFGAAVSAAGFLTNDSFSGVSAFDRKKPYRAELARFFKVPGERHLVMCHPGFVDDELSTLDPVVDRRVDELSALKGYDGLPDRIWHPLRRPDGAVIWPGTADG